MKICSLISACRRDGLLMYVCHRGRALVIRDKCLISRAVVDTRARLLLYECVLCSCVSVGGCLPRLYAKPAHCIPMISSSPVVIYIHQTRSDGEVRLYIWYSQQLPHATRRCCTFVYRQTPLGIQHVAQKYGAYRSVHIKYRILRTQGLRSIAHSLYILAPGVACT